MKCRLALPGIAHGTRNPGPPVPDYWALPTLSVYRKVRQSSGKAGLGTDWGARVWGALYNSVNLQKATSMLSQKQTPLQIKAKWWKMSVFRATKGYLARVASSVLPGCKLEDPWSPSLSGPRTPVSSSEPVNSIAVLPLQKLSLKDIENILRNCG